MMWTRLRDAVRLLGDRGVTTVEMGIIIGAVALAVIPAVLWIRGNLANSFDAGMQGTGTCVNCSNAYGTLALRPGEANTAPQISSLYPTSGPSAGGTTVTIFGSNLSAATAVMFGANAATSFTIVNATQITAVTPAGSLGSVTVSIPAPTGIATKVNGYRYQDGPTVTSVSPATGMAGDTVTITGTLFSGVTDVAFGGVAATSFTFVSATSITAQVPAGSGTVAVSVTTGKGTGSLPSAFSYAVRPTVSSISPAYGSTAGGSLVTITGTNFTGASAVKFGGTNATSFSVASSTSIKAIVPAGSAGGAEVTVTSSGLSDTDTNTFTYVNCASGVPDPGSGTCRTLSYTNEDGGTMTAGSALESGQLAAASSVINAGSLQIVSAPSGSTGFTVSRTANRKITLTTSGTATGTVVVFYTYVVSSTTYYATVAFTVT